MSAERRYAYVGPEEIRQRCQDMPAGARIEDRAGLLLWLEQDEGWATYTVGLDGFLNLAPRRSEHVACAAGAQVLAAGEVCFDKAGELLELSNLSTGYCPSEACFGAAQRALLRCGVSVPDGFTFTAIFRRCESCGERNLVKDEHYFCAICDAALPERWNFEE